MTVPKRFGVLRFFATLLKVLAWIFLIGGILAAIGAAVFGSTLTGLAGGMTGGLPVGGADALAAGGGIIVAVVVLIVSLLYFLALYVAGESIHMQLAVEENTRLTAALLLRMHQEGQAADTTGATPYGAGGGFSNEPYE